MNDRPDLMVTFTLKGSPTGGKDLQVSYRASQVERATDLKDGSGCTVKIRDAADVEVAEGAKYVAAAVNRALLGQP